MWRYIKPILNSICLTQLSLFYKAYVISFQCLFTQNIQRDTFFIYIFLDIQNSYFLYELLIPEHWLKGGMDPRFTNFHKGLYL